MKNYSLYIAFLLLVCVSHLTTAQNIWEQTNGPCGGILSALFTDETGYLIAGTTSGSIFLSTDFGANWNITGFSHYDVRITSFAKNEYIFAGTFGYGVYRSTNSGYTWEQVNNGLAEMNVLSIIADSNGWLYASHQNSYLSRSTNEGLSWTQMSNGFNNSCVYKLAIHPTGYLLAGTGGGLFRSTNGGLSWEFVYADPYITEILHLSVNSQGYIYVGNYGGLYRSMDSGLNWDRLPTGTYPDQIFTFKINPNDVIFVGNNNGVLRSTDDGDTWAIKNPILFDSSYIPLPWVFAFFGTETVLTGLGNHGIYMSSNNGETWIERNAGLNSHSILSLGISDTGLLMAGILNGASLFISNNFGVSWYQADLGIEGAVFCMTSYGDRIYVGTDLNIYLSTNGGSTWIPKDNGLFHRDIHALLYNEITNTLFAGTRSGIFRSTNGGDDWIESGLQGKYVGGLVMSMSNDIYASAGTNFEWSIYHSTNNGQDWNQTTLIGDQISSIQVDGHGNIFACYAKFYIDPQSGVYRSTDKGLTWRHSNNGLTDSTARRVFVNSTGNLFVSTGHQGIFRSDDSGEMWYPWTEGLWNTAVDCFTIDSDGFLYAGTNGSSVFRTINSTTSVEPNHYDQPITLVLYQNYPNPFNPSTKIKFEIPERDFISLKVYDVLGREITTLVNEEKQPGTYEVEFNADNLASGIYFYQLQAGDFISTKKLVLLK